MAGEKKENQDQGKLGGLERFFRETWTEMKKVTWPDSAKVLRSTLVVLLIVVVIGAFIAALDYIFTTGLHLSLNLAKGVK